MTRGLRTTAELPTTANTRTSCTARVRTSIPGPSPPVDSPIGLPSRFVESYGTPLNNVWSTVGPQIYEVVKNAVKTRISVDPARFVTHGQDGEDTLGPVVISDYGLSSFYLARHRLRGLSSHPHTSQSEWSREG